MTVPESGMNDDAKDFLLRCRSRYAPDTLICKQHYIRTYFAWLEKKRLDYRTVSQADVENFLRSLKVTVRKLTLFTVFQFYEFTDCRINPAADIHIRERRRAPPLPKKLPSQAAIESIIAALHDPQSEIALRNRLMVELAYGSGLRRKEMAMLDIEDVNLSEQTVCVRKGKGGKMRIIPVTHRAVETLRAYLQERGNESAVARGSLLVSFHKKRRLHPGSVGQLFKVATGYNAHSFRHACATHLLRAGCDLRYIQQLLGHTNITTTQVYTKIDRTHLAKVLARAHPRAKR